MEKQSENEKKVERLMIVSVDRKRGVGKELKREKAEVENEEKVREIVSVDRKYMEEERKKE